MCLLAFVGGGVFAPTAHFVYMLSGSPPQPSHAMHHTDVAHGKKVSAAPGMEGSLAVPRSHDHAPCQFAKLLGSMSAGLAPHVACTCVVLPTHRDLVAAILSSPASRMVGAHGARGPPAMFA